MFWITVGIGYGIRTVVQFLYGYYYLFIKQLFWRWMLYLISCPLLDIPSVVYVFYVHYKTFKSIPISTKLTNEFEESSFKSISEEQDLELLHFNLDLAMNFHEL